MARRSFQVSSSVTRGRQEESGKVLFWSHTLRNWKFWTRQKLTLEGSAQRKFSRHRTVKNLYSLSQMKQSNWQEVIRHSEHSLCFRIVLHEAKGTTVFFRVSQTGLYHRTNKRMALKPDMISWVFFGHHICRHLRSTKGFSQFHWSTLMLSGGQT